MEPFGIFGAFFGLIIMLFGLAWAIFCIALFIKVWGMCNDVNKILQILSQKKIEG